MVSDCLYSNKLSKDGTTRLLKTNVVAGMMTVRESLAAGAPIITSMAFMGSSLSALFLTMLRMLTSIPGMYLIGKASGVSFKHPQGFTKSLMLMGMVLMPVVGYSYLYGIYFTNAVNAAAVNSAQPIVSAVMAILMGREKITTKKLLAIIMTTIGCFVLVYMDDDKSIAYNPHANMFLGNLLIIICMVFYALLLIVQAPIVAHHNPMVVTWYTFVYGLPTTAIVSLFEFHIRGMAMLDAIVGSRAILVWSAVLYYSWIATCVTWTLSGISVKHVGPSITAAFQPLQPIVTAILSIIILREYPSTNQYYGIVLVVIGIFGVLYARNCENKTAATVPAPIQLKVIVDHTPAPPAPEPKKEAKEEMDMLSLTRGEYIGHFDNRDPLSRLMTDLSIKHHQGL